VASASRITLPAFRIVSARALSDSAPDQVSPPYGNPTRVSASANNTSYNDERGLAAHEVQKSTRLACTTRGQRPPARMRLEIAQRVLVDLDERDVFARRQRIHGTRQAPVVGLELDRAERLEAGEHQHDERRRQPDRQPRNSFSHVW
jgi:hypothetical protein